MRPGWEGSATIFPSHLKVLQPALVLGSGRSDGDGGGEDGLNDGGVEVHIIVFGRLNFLNQKLTTCIKLTF